MCAVGLLFIASHKASAQELVTPAPYAPPAVYYPDTYYYSAPYVGGVYYQPYIGLYGGAYWAARYYGGDRYWGGRYWGGYGGRYAYARGGYRGGYWRR